MKVIQACPGCQTAKNNFDFVHRAERFVDTFGGVGAVKYTGPLPPAPHSGLADPYFLCQLGHTEGGVVLNKCPVSRRGRGVLVKVNFHFNYLFLLKFFSILSDAIRLILLSIGAENMPAIYIF